MVKNPPAIAVDVRNSGLIPRLGRFPERGHSNPLPFLSGASHGQTNLGAYSP